MLGDQDHVGAAGDAAHHRDPARVAAHHLDDHDAVVRLRRRVQAVDRLGRDADRGVEAEGVVGAREVVVDRLRDADDRQLSSAKQACRDAERVLAADRDERVEARGREVLQHPLDAALELVRVRPARADDRAAAREDPRDLARAERPRRSASTRPRQPSRTPTTSQPAVVRAPADGADDRVQPGAVAAAGEDADALRHPAEPRCSGVRPER